MANLPQQDTIVQYLADGISTNYTVPFYVPLEADGTPDMDVFTQAQDAEPVPIQDIKIWGVDYIYTPALDPITGGVLTFLVGHIPDNDWVVTITRNVSASLDVEFSNATNFSGYTLDAALDKLLLICQQNKTYALERNLSYIINSYLPEDVVNANTQIPVLSEGQTWFGSSNGVIAATLEQPADVSTLRSELANAQPVTNGAGIVGYYDDVNEVSTTVAAQLNYLTGYVLNAMPTGTVIDFASDTPPVGFLMCDGSAVSRTTYDDLFAVIGTKWGDGDGSSTFNLPNLNRRVTVGSGGTGTVTLPNTVGSTGGTETTTLTADNLPAHTHPLNGFTGAKNNTGGISGTLDVGTASAASTLENTNPNTPFNIMQPSAVMLKAIKT